jgi:hypothetical protein
LRFGALQDRLANMANADADADVRRRAAEIIQQKRGSNLADPTRLSMEL